MVERINLKFNIDDVKSFFRDDYVPLRNKTRSQRNYFSTPENSAINYLDLIVDKESELIAFRLSSIKRDIKRSFEAIVLAEGLGLASAVDSDQSANNIFRDIYSSLEIVVNHYNSLNENPAEVNSNSAVYLKRSIDFIRDYYLVLACLFNTETRAATIEIIDSKLATIDKIKLYDLAKSNGAYTEE